MMNQSSARSIVLLAFVGEGALYLLSLPWLLHQGTSPLVDTTFVTLLVGVALALTLYGISVRWIESLLAHCRPSAYRKLYQQVLLPLAKDLRNTDIFWIAFLSGTAEEIFFRGALPWYFSSMGFGLLAAHGMSNLLFAAVHFIGSFREYGTLIPLYFLVGSLLSLLALSFDSLVPAMVCHALLNFLSLRSLRRRAK